MMRCTIQTLTLVTLGLGALACGEPDGALATIEKPPEKECNRETAPRTYEAFFVIDVSGSMAPFLNNVKDQLVDLTLNFPEFDADGRPTRIDYYVVAFVNDVKWFPEGPGAQRMTNHIHVGSAFELAIKAGAGGNNLTRGVLNAEAKENLLDAIREVLERPSDAEARLMLIATDADFAEHPDVLSTNFEVKSTYASIFADLEAAQFRVHAFTRSELDGLTRTYRNMPPLTSLKGSTQHNLADLAGSQGKISQTLTEIAENAGCN